ncbi:hypothetical protein JC221_042 [Yersinia phage JC221]|nr:hypothetical protein JC221_042 [Yersinia phage JC221]
MNISKELEGKAIKLVDIARFEKMANGGESLGDALGMLSEMRVKRVSGAWVVCLPLSMENKAVYDPVADSWDCEVCLVNTEAELCYEVVV